MSRPDVQLVCRCTDESCEEMTFVSHDMAVRIRDEDLMLIIDGHPVLPSDEIVDKCPGEKYTLYNERD